MEQFFISEKDSDYINNKYNIDVHGWTWLKLSRFPIPNKLIHEFKDNLDWENLIMFQPNLNITFIKNHLNYLGNPDSFIWFYISNYWKLSDKFKQEFKRYLNNSQNKFFDINTKDNKNIKYLSQKEQEYIFKKYNLNFKVYSEWTYIYLNSNVHINQNEKREIDAYEQFIEEYKDLLDWNKVISSSRKEDRTSNYQYIKLIIDNSINIKYPSIIKYICKFWDLSDSILEYFKDYLDWSAISNYQPLTEEQILKYKDYVDWTNICIYQRLSEQFIEDNTNLIQWKYIERFQHVSKSFIQKHLKDIQLSTITGLTILSIDPGNEKSAYVLMNSNKTPIKQGLIENNDLLEIMNELNYDALVIEMVASYGMAVGKTVFDTCVWIGRFIEKATQKNIPYSRIYRIDEKIYICHDSRAKDSNIRQALIDEFGEVGTSKNPGFFYGFKKDIWAAFAVGVTFYKKIEEYLIKSKKENYKNIDVLDIYENNLN